MRIHTCTHCLLLCIVLSFRTVASLPNVAQPPGAKLHDILVLLWFITAFRGMMNPHTGLMLVAPQSLVSNILSVLRPKPFQTGRASFI